MKYLHQIMELCLKGGVKICFMNTISTALVGKSKVKLNKSAEELD